jgi:hypothetical protein
VPPDQRLPPRTYSLENGVPVDLHDALLELPLKKPTADGRARIGSTPADFAAHGGGTLPLTAGVRLGRRPTDGSLFEEDQLELQPGVAGLQNTDDGGDVISALERPPSPMLPSASSFRREKGQKVVQQTLM